MDNKDSCVGSRHRLFCEFEVDYAIMNGVAQYQR